MEQWNIDNTGINVCQIWPNLVCVASAGVQHSFSISKEIPSLGGLNFFGKPEVYRKHKHAVLSLTVNQTPITQWLHILEYFAGNKFFFHVILNHLSGISVIKVFSFKTKQIPMNVHFSLIALSNNLWSLMILTYLIWSKHKTLILNNNFWLYRYMKFKKIVPFQTSLQSFIHFQIKSWLNIEQISILTSDLDFWPCDLE